MRRALAVAALAVVVLGACRSSGKDDPTSPGAIAFHEGAVSRSLAGRLDVEIEGAIEASWKGETPLRVVTVVGSGAPKSTWLLSVGLEQPLDIGGGRMIRTAFDLVGYHGTGTYKIQAPKAGGLTADELEASKGQDPSKVAGQSANSAAFLLTAASPTEDPEQYVKIDQPCTLTVQAKGNQGRLACPKLTSATGSVSLTWSWEADPDKVLRDDTPSSATTTSTKATSGTGAATTTSTSSPATSRTTAVNATATTTTAKGVEGGDVPIDVVIAPKCLTRGTVMRVTITSIPDAAITVAAAYSDGKNYETTSLGRTDENGVYRMATPIPAEAPDGPAQLLVSVTNSAGDRAGAKSEPFQVEPKC